jgi:diguanylate cyclase (GGDEF)-like protein
LRLCIKQRIGIHSKDEPWAPFGLQGNIQAAIHAPRNFSEPYLSRPTTITAPGRTVLKRSLRRPAARKDALRSLHQNVLEAVAAGEPLVFVGELLCREVQRLAPGVVCSILTIDDQGRLRPLACPGLPEAFSGSLDGVTIGPNVGSCGSAAYFGHPIAVLDIDQDPRWTLYKELLLADGLRACWSSPIKGRDARVVGTFAFYYRTQRGPSELERLIVDVSVHLCALAIEREGVRGHLELANHRFDVILNNMSQGVSFFGNHHLIVANRRYSEIYDLPPGSVVPGMTLRQIVDLRASAGSGPAMPANDYIARFDAIQATDTPTDTIVELTNGRMIAIQHHPLPNSEWVSTHEDITDRRRAEAQMVYMAHHDALTGLPNRALFSDRLQQALAFSGNGFESAVLCIDLKRVGFVNETLGRSAGDGLLQNVASRLQTCVREIDLVARLGGKEFAVLLVGVTQPDDAERLAQRIVGVLSDPFELDDERVVVRPSVGIALSPHDGTTSSELIKSAAIAVSRAKADHQVHYRFFESEMDARIQDRFALERDLREAAKNNEFELVYQPIVSLISDSVCSFEALIRWRHPVRGLILPNEFIPFAEESGLVEPLGAWVLNQACKEAACWPTSVKVAVNLSAVQLRSRSIIDTVRQALLTSGLPSSRLELEITETVLLNNSSGALAILNELHELGASIAMDDFGTGYSSLSYLRSFPFDKIKIDQSFVQDLSEDENTAAVIRAAVGLARSLGMLTTAEGVETSGQLAQLRREGCDQAQGYLFGYPVPFEKALHMISSHHRAFGSSWQAT